MDTPDLFFRLCVALAIGLLIGVERGWKTREEAEGERATGLRTLALTGLLGGVMGAVGVATDNSGLVVALGFLAFAPVIAFFRYREMAHDGTYGATTVMAALVAFALGALAVLGEPAVAAATGVAASALLALKAVLHGWLKKLTWEELRAGLVLLAMTLILLPLLPDRAIGPYDAINPYELWLMTILIAAVSSAGYIALKWGGPSQGAVISGLGGGLVSSTAVTLAFSRLAREHPERLSALAAGTLLAGMTMMLRILVLVGAVNPALLRWLVLPLVLAALGTGLSAAWHLRRAQEGRGGAPLELGNPFELTTVLEFGAFLAVVMVVAKAATAVAGGWGALALAAASGLADVDAITLTMSRIGTARITLETASGAILAAAATNTVAKAALAWIAGGRRSGVAVGSGALIALALGALGFALARVAAPLAAI
jgi:uncharacterized membrane protein (DUF4010 family)